MIYTFMGNMGRYPGPTGNMISWPHVQHQKSKAYKSCK